MSTQIRFIDNLLDEASHRRVASFLDGLNWSYGAFSGSGRLASRYLYSHFAGVVAKSQELMDNRDFERELRQNAPPVYDLWSALQGSVLSDHRLIRCYANAYPYGSEGSCHVDADQAGHFTAIYYPHLDWHPDYGGETVFFNPERSDIIASAYPKPNRLVIFAGEIPHVARGVSRQCPQLRTTLMFKTATGVA